MPAKLGTVRIGMFALAISCLMYADERRASLRPLPQLDQNPKTGPAVGATIPGFDAVDQNGNKQTFETLRGPKGLVLLFVRSADW